MFFFNLIVREMLFYMSSAVIKYFFFFSMNFCKVLRNINKCLNEFEKNLKRNNLGFSRIDVYLRVAF